MVRLSFQHESKQSLGREFLMKHLSRRELLLGASLLVLSKNAEAGINNPGSASSQQPVTPGFNGGLTQTNTLGAIGPGGWFFINWIKGGNEIFYLSPPTDPTAPSAPIIELDANGYPTTLVTGTGGYGTNFTIPNANVYSGKWVLTWDGTGTVSPANFTFTTTLSTANRREFTNQDTATNWTSCFLFIQSFSNTPNHVRNLKMFRLADETAVNAGQVWLPEHLTLMKSAKPGAIRSLGWGGDFNGTNTALIGLWSQRKPTGYVTWTGQILNPAWFPGATGGAGTTTRSGTDYTLSYSGFTLADKVVVQLIFDSDVPHRNNATVTLSWSTTNTVAINVNWASHGLAVGNTIVMGNSSSPPSAITSGQIYFVSNVVDANNFNISATSGGASILATATTSGSMQIATVPRININSTGFVKLTDFQTPVATNIGSICGTTPKAGLSTIIYDATTGWFHIGRSDGAGLTCGSPPEVFIDYCAAIGSHPWMTAPFMTQTTSGALGGVTDFMTSWVTYAKNNYSWMKPLIEPYNETWNPSLAGLGTFYASTLAYTLWPAQAPTSRPVDECYGKWVSDLGQAMSAIYGNDRTKYSMLCMGQAVTFHDAASLNINDPRLVSNLYVSVSGGQAAYKFCDRVGAATYYNTPQLDGVSEIQSAFSYVITNAGNPSGQAAVAEAYATTANDGTDRAFTLKYVKNTFVNIKAWGLGLNGGSTVPNAAGGNTVKGIVSYEGGWGPDVPIGDGNWTTPVASSGNITNANPCVVTLSTAANNSADGGYSFSGNPGVVGMVVNLSGVNVAGMPEINNNLVKCTFTNGSASIAGVQSLVVNQGVSFTGTPPTPFVAGTQYFVISTGLSNTAFQLSATQGGSAITATAGGTGWLNSSNNLSCSFASGSANITAAQTLLVNQAVIFPTTFGSLPANVKFDTPYYVVASTNSTFQISATRGGTAIVASGNASCTAQVGWFVTAVGVSTITLDLDSTGFGTWTSGGTVTWTQNGRWTDTLRIAALLTNAMGTNNTQMYTDFYALGAGGFTAEYCSNFLYFGNAGAWSVIQPNILTATLTPCWNSIVAKN